MLGQSFGGYGAPSGGGPAGGARRASNADFMNKVRKRRETSADITVYRKGSIAGPMGGAADE